MHNSMDKLRHDQDFLSELGSATEPDAMPDDDPDVVVGMARLQRLRAVEDEIPVVGPSDGFGGRPREGRPRRT